MDEPIPTEYFTNIAYNSQFYTQPNGISLTVGDERYLKRIVGNHTSNASSTSFINSLFSGGLTSTGSITGPLISATSINNSGSYGGGLLNINSATHGLNAIAIGNQSAINGQGDSSIAIGYQAGYTLQNINSIAIGVDAGHFTQSYSSIAIGYQAGYAQQNNSSVAIGLQAAYTGQGFESVAIGNLAGYTRQSDFAIAIGSRAGQTNQGDFSICIGHDSEATGDYSVALGTNSVAIGSHNISIGTVNETINLNGNTTLPILNSTTINNSGITNTGGLNSTGSITGPLVSCSSISNSGSYTGNNIYGTAIQSVGNINCGGLNSTNTITGPLISATSISNSGDYSGNLKVTGTKVALGYLAGTTAQGLSTVALGYQAGNLNQGISSSAFGALAGKNYQGAYSVAFGGNAAQDNQGTSSIAIGNYAGSYYQGNYSTAIGLQAGYTQQGNYCTAIGYYAGFTNQGTGSIAIGTYAGYNTQDAYAVAIGHQAGQQAQGTGSVAIGYQAGLIQGINSVSIGNQAGRNNQGPNSVAIGYQAGLNNQGQNSICIGTNSSSTGNSSIAIGNNSIATGNNNVSIATTNETINLNGDTTCKSLVSLSTQDSSIDTPTLGSIISNGGIKVSKNIYGQNFQTDNNNYLDGIISKTYPGGNELIGTLVVPYLTVNTSNNLLGLKFYSMDINSGLGANIELQSPLSLRCTTGGTPTRSGTTLTYYTFNLSISNINLVVYKNSSLFSTQPMTPAENNTSFDFTHQGDTTGTQLFNFILYMTYVYTTFILTPDTSGSTDTYDFYVSLDLVYTSVVTYPLTAGSTIFNVECNIPYTGLSGLLTGGGCTVTSLSSSATSNPGAKLYCHTASPYSYGTSYTNILNCNNIKMLSTGIITKETVLTEALSTYQSYLTVRDCGVYMYNGSSGVYATYPIYCSIPNFNNFFTQTATGNLNSFNVANGGGLGVGEYVNLNFVNDDEFFLIYPEYGIIMWDGAPPGGTITINYYNSTLAPIMVGAVTRNRGDYCKIYYRNVEITSY